MILSVSYNWKQTREGNQAKTYLKHLYHRLQLVVERPARTVWGLINLTKSLNLPVCTKDAIKKAYKKPLNSMQVSLIQFMQKHTFTLTSTTQFWMFSQSTKQTTLCKIALWNWLLWATLNLQRNPSRWFQHRKIFAILRPMLK